MNQKNKQNIGKYSITLRATQKKKNIRKDKIYNNLILLERFTLFGLDWQLAWCNLITNSILIGNLKKYIHIVLLFFISFT